MLQLHVAAERRQEEEESAPRGGKAPKKARGGRSAMSNAERMMHDVLFVQPVLVSIVRFKSKRTRKLPPPKEAVQMAAMSVAAVTAKHDFKYAEEFKAVVDVGLLIGMPGEDASPEEVAAANKELWDDLVELWRDMRGTHK